MTSEEGKRVKKFAQRLKVTLLFLEGCLERLQSFLYHTHLLCAASGEGMKGEGGEGGEGGGGRKLCGVLMCALHG